MKKLYIPQNYSSRISPRDTQKAIKLIKDTFQLELGRVLNLDRVTAPIIVTRESGINDDLNGVERKVHFTMKEIDGVGEVVSRFQPQLGGRGGEDHAEKEREQQCDDKIPDLRVPREPRDEFVQNQADGCRDGGRCRHERDKEEHEGEPDAPPRMPLLIFFFHG